MDRRERWENPHEALLVALQGWQAGMWTALPGYIVDYNPAAKTCTVQPTIKGRIQAPDGTFSTKQLPTLLDCPVVFPSGGGYTLTFPIAPNDECLVVFSSRCIDNWWYSGGIQDQAMVRMHDLSDGFVFVGCSSKPHVQPNISSTAVQLRNDAGTVYLEMTGTAVNIVSATLTHNGVNIGSTHVHSDPQGGNTGVPH